MQEQFETQQENSSSQNTVMMTVVGALILAIVGFGYLYSNSSKTPAMNQNSTEQKVTEQAPAASPTNNTMPTDESQAVVDEKTVVTDEALAEIKTINMEAGAFYYLPAEIKVKKGEKVKIVFTSKDMMHDFNVDELGIKSPIVKSGQTAEFEFSADKVGTFEYYCSVGQHRAQGQIGKLIVE